MEKYHSESRCLASLAVFRELYNSQKDIYSVIAEFLKQVIISHSKYEFSLSEITALLNDTYDFQIPDAVVKTSLKRLNFLNREAVIYTVNNVTDLQSNKIDEKQSFLEKENEIIFDHLINFIEKEKKCTLTPEEIEKVIHSFCSFLLDESNGHDYSEYVSAFILKNKENTSFQSQLRTIKEGVILYSGIKYNFKLNEVGSWKTELTIYLDTEVLFHFAGYNGEMYKSIFFDLFKYIKEINATGEKKKIFLRYFKDVREEIDNFFLKAEYIIRGQDKPNPSVTAMSTILDGCKEPSDIIRKKTVFYDSLRTSGISEDNYPEYYSPVNHKYNIVDKTIIKQVSEGLEIEDISHHLKFLNYISIHRAEANKNNFDNIGHILLSGNSNTIRVAWHSLIKLPGDVPLATDISFLTNKFWFKLNKGFGPGNYPKSFDILTKAQIVLSTQLNNSVGRQYEDLQKQFKNGELTEEQAISTIVNLRSATKKPEDINDDIIDNVLDTITESSIEKYLLEQEHFRVKSKNQEEENKKLKTTLSLKSEEIESNRIESLQLKDKIKQLELESKQNLLALKEKMLSDSVSKKHDLDKDISKKYGNYKVAVSSVILGYYFILIYCSITISWNFIEKWTFIIPGTLPVLISFLYSIIKEKSFNLLQFLKRKRENIIIKVYGEASFDENNISKLEKEITVIKSDIDLLIETS